MAYYNVCPDCGANLDPGELCDCNNEKTEKMEIMKEMFRASPVTSQYEFRFEGAGKRSSGFIG